MTSYDSEEDDPNYYPPSDCESETTTDIEDDFCCTCEDSWYVDNGDPEDALQSGIMTFIANRYHLDADHVPLYTELLRNLLKEAEDLYK
jgi:hypothetical protein